MTSPAPRPWRIQRLEIIARSDREVLGVLREAERDIQRMLREIERRYAGHSLTAALRRQQLQLIRTNIKIEQAKIWRKLGNIIKVRRLEAAMRMIKLGQEFDRFLLETLGKLTTGSQIAEALAISEERLAETGIERMLARFYGRSYVSLSQRVYRSEVAINGQLDRAINSALARGLSAKEFAKEIAGYINPNTPGGLRYAAMRLSRTEINNAAHAISIINAQGKPWIDGMAWHLSGSHPRPDVCDALAAGGPEGDGVYPTTEVPAKPHPHCLCYVVPEVESNARFLNNLNSGKYDAKIHEMEQLFDRLQAA